MGWVEYYFKRSNVLEKDGKRISKLVHNGKVANFHNIVFEDDINLRDSTSRQELISSDSVFDYTRVVNMWITFEASGKSYNLPLKFENNGSGPVSAEIRWYEQSGVFGKPSINMDISIGEPGFQNFPDSGIWAIGLNRIQPTIGISNLKIHITYI